MVTYQFYKTLCEDAKQIREKVFVQEQGFQNEFDELDKTALHLVLYNDGNAAGTARMMPVEDDPEARVLGRIAILPQYRGLHLGNLILRSLEEKAREQGARKTVVSAQCRARLFYEKNGYQASGEIYLDEYCEHILSLIHIC